jgi:hypothetical protein
LGDGKAEDDRDDQLEDLPCPFVAPVKARAKLKRPSNKTLIEEG